MKCLGISDLHGYLPKDLPECDILCIAGDIVPLEYQRDCEQSVAWFCLEFVPWTDSLSCKKVILVGGNHDFFLESLHKNTTVTNSSARHTWRSPSDALKRLLPGNNKGKHKIVYLCDNSVEIEGKKFYGTPWIADLDKWAFYLPEDELKKKYSLIPKKCDVLITHMPPKFCGIGQVQQHSFNYLADYGSQCLAEAIESRDITWCISGHVHSGTHYPQIIKENCFAANVSLKNEDYEPQYYPLEFEI